MAIETNDCGNRLFIMIIVRLYYCLSFIILVVIITISNVFVLVVTASS